jgi:hypothetical protein
MEIPRTPAAFIVGFLSLRPPTSTARLNWDILPQLHTRTSDKTSEQTTLNENDPSSRIHVVETLIGVFGVTEDNEIVEAVLYPMNPDKISAALDRQSSGEVSREVADAMEKLVQRGFDAFVFTNRALAETVRRKYGVQVDAVGRSEADGFVRENLEALAVEHGMVEDASRFYALSQKVTTLTARKLVQRAQSERSVIVIQAAQLLNELDKTLNVLSNKLREWYGVHFPDQRLWRQGQHRGGAPEGARPRQTVLIHNVFGQGLHGSGRLT